MAIVKFENEKKTECENLDTTWSISKRNKKGMMKILDLKHRTNATRPLRTACSSESLIRGKTRLQ